TSWVDDIYALIATKQLYVDLKGIGLSEPEKVHLFSSQQVAEAYNLIMSKKAAATLDKGQQIDVAVGATVFWDGKSLSVIQIGEKKIVLQGENHLIGLSH
ncbi:MAG: integrase, partial [Nostoc sp.]